MQGETIILSGEQLEIPQGLTVDASALYDAERGVPGLTLDAAGQSRVFSVSGGTADAPVELIGLTITGGNASGDGGGVYASGTTTFTNCTVSGNTATGSTYSYGGGVYAKGTTTFTNCAVSGNAATGSYSYGGGVYVYSGTTTFTNCAVSGNAATGGNSYGGGVYASGTTTLTNCTVSGNTAKSGGGVYVSSGTTTLCNSIVALNYAKDDIYGSLSPNSANNLIGYDPNFVVAPIFDAKGGLTNGSSLDLRPSSKSWAIDRGDNSFISGVSTDLAGNARVKRSWSGAATVDLGAYEYQSETWVETPALVVTTATDVVDLTDDQISLREAIFYAE